MVKAGDGLGKDRGNLVVFGQIHYSFPANFAPKRT